MRQTLVLVTLVATLVASLGLAAPAGGAEAPIKVAVIVGPVGDELTPVYISLADAAASAAETRGATVARAYSPAATAEKVLEAVAGASIVVYLGHGVGTPNPYADEASAETMNGWGLNGPGSDGITHADSFDDGSLAYYGEAWIAEHAEPAPGWVMIYSNACYAPGAGEGFDEPADEATAAARVSAYSRAPLAELGASAYFATDYYAGAAHLVGALLDHPDLPYGEVFASDPNFDADGLARLPHGLLDGAEAWLHRSTYFDGVTDYWYAFAGDPAAFLGLGHGLGARWQPGMAVPPAGLIRGMAMAYPESPGHEGQATVALPPELGAAVPVGTTTVLVCASRCAELAIVGHLPLQAATGGAQPILALSQHAWALLTDQPVSGTPLRVSLRLHPPPPRPPLPASSADVAAPPAIAPPQQTLVSPLPVPAQPPASPGLSPSPVPTPTPAPSPTASSSPSTTPSPATEPSPTPSETAPAPSATASPSAPPP